ncbi:E3 ubiquitin-protein ligase RNF125-like [Physella acuta]|uniref:E3 ubiquitin-protein ligase RNF125-like n=1 Tax=Physella acuta TaxID=109671 RepID=UPI0027DE2D0E|nr:E3 ubiquitin-protein ligase RNF125-like [Physella acuta]
MIEYSGSFTNLWATFRRRETPLQRKQLPRRSINAWRPKSCQQKGTFYEFDNDEVVQDSASIKSVEEPGSKKSSIVKVKCKICGICRRKPWDPFSLECGHIFCRSCLAHIRPLLLQEFPIPMQNYRANLKCPFPNCTQTIPCLPLLNGDFRFSKFYPEDKKSILEKNSLWESEDMKRFKLHIDVDMASKSHTYI